MLRETFRTAEELNRTMTSHASKHPHDDAPDTEADFARLARLPDGAEKDQLRQSLVCAWLPMAHRLAVRFRDRGESLDDLQQVAALGLVKAVDRYEPERGFAFASFAVPTITGEIKRHFRDRLWSVHVPRRIQDIRQRIRTAHVELAEATNGGDTPTDEQVAEHTGMSEEEVREGNQALGSFRSLSLDAEMAGAGEGLSLADSLGESDGNFDVVVDREAVKPKLVELPERERNILYLRFFRGLSQRSIAEEMGMSQMHVSRLLRRSCNRVREKVLGDAA